MIRRALHARAARACSPSRPKHSARRDPLPVFNVNFGGMEKLQGKSFPANLRRILRATSENGYRVEATTRIIFHDS